MNHLTAGRPTCSQSLVCSLPPLLLLLLLLAALALLGHSERSQALTANKNSGSNSTGGEQLLMQINAKTNTSASAGHNDGRDQDDTKLSQGQQSSPAQSDERQPGTMPSGAGDKNYKLPSWFNHNAFKQLYGKRYESRFANELHKRIYLETALKVFQQRALYRLGRLSSLASVNELSDLTGEQLNEFKERHKKQDERQLTSQRPATTPAAAARDGTQTTGPAGDEEGRRAGLPECCSYDQVFARIIGMLKSATDSNDTELSRALVDELEQRALVRDRPEASQVGADLGAHSRVAPRERADERAASSRADEEAAWRRAAVELALDEQIATIRSNTLQQQQQQQQRRRQPSPGQAAGGSKQKTYRQQAAHSVKPAGPNGQQQQQQQRQAQVIERSLALAGPEVVSDGRAAARAVAASSPAAAGANRSGASASTNADADEELSRQIGDAVQKELNEQLSPSSAAGRELNKRLSAFLGQSVELQARLSGPIETTSGGGGGGASSSSAGTSQRRPPPQQQQPPSPSLPPPPPPLSS